MQDKYVEYIQYALRNKPVAYQLGFLQAILAQLMLDDSKNYERFKRQVNKVNQTHELRD